MKRLALIGLDCVDPVLLRQLLPMLPTLRRLAEGGSFTRLRSVDPPITIPAWMCMMTGKDPGQLGVYGFRNRIDHSYESLGIASSAAFRAEAVWDTLGRDGFRSILLGIPGTFPPRPIRGLMIAGFLAPSTDATYTYPKSLSGDVRKWVGDYMFDVRGFRTHDKAWLVEQIHEMTRKRFTVARRLIESKKWDFFAMVEIGPDRIHHGLWAHHDVDHPKHDPRSPFVGSLLEYYRLLDREVATLMELFPSSTEVWIVSDHGVQPMLGGIGINEWLVREGYLSLRGRPVAGTRLPDLIREGQVDWSKTLAWGAGGYYGRLFLNVEGREPQGVIAPRDVDSVRTEIAEGLERIPDEMGHAIGTRVLYPEELYSTAGGIPPDLLVYFGDLTWRSIGTVGWETIHFHENDTGPDDANHAPYGVFLSSSVGNPGDRQLLSIHDSVLAHFGIGEGL